MFVLYQQDLLKLGVEAALRRTEEGAPDDYACRIVKGVESERTTIDELIDHYLSGWSLGRLGVLERAILRVAAYELVRETEVPVAVVIDEAVNLARRFCSDEAGALVNGVLGNMSRSLASERRGCADNREGVR